MDWRVKKHEESCNKPKKSIKCAFCKEFQGTNKEIKQHKKSCSARSRFDLSPCPKGCGAKIMPKNIDTHVCEKCPLIIVKCKYCKDFQAPQKEMKDHEKSCPAKLVCVSCPNVCGVWLMPNEVNAHIYNHCPHTLIFCDHCKTFQAPRNKMNKHVKSCPGPIPKPKARKEARLSPCPAGCGVQLKPINIERHIHEDCPLTVVVCKYCKKFKAPPKKTKSHEELCPSNIEVCPNGCGMKMHTSNIKAHTDNECTLTVISCEFAYTGCKVEKRRCEMDKHIEEEHPFLASMTRKVKQLEVKVKELKLDNEHLVCLCSDINRLQRENKLLKKSLLSMSGETDMLQYRRLKLQNENLQSNVEMLKKEVAKLKPSDHKATKHRCVMVEITLPKRLQKRMLDCQDEVRL